MSHRSEADDARDHVEFVIGQIERLEHQLRDAQKAASEHRSAAIGFMEQRTQAEADRDEARRLHALAAGNADHFQRDLRETKQLLDASNTAEEYLQGEVARLKGIIKAEPHNMLGHMTSTLRLVIPLMIQLEALVAPDKRDPEHAGLWGNPGEIAYKTIVVLNNVAKLHGLAQQYAEYFQETGDNPGDLFGGPPEPTDRPRDTQTGWGEDGPVPTEEQPW